jgi:hypothetical protein
MIIKTAIIRKLKSGKYRLYSRKKDKSGKRRNLGTYDSLEAVKKREKAIQYFKQHADDGKNEDKDTKVVSKLSDIATFLEKAGYISAADKVYCAMDAIDGSFNDDEDYLVDQMIPDNQLALPGSMDYMMTGEPAGGMQGAFSIPEAEKVAALANKLDKLGYYDEADELDLILCEADIVRNATYESFYGGLDKETMIKANRSLSMLTPPSWLLSEYRQSKKRGDYLGSWLSMYLAYIRKPNKYLGLADPGAKRILDRQDISMEDFGGPIELAKLYDAVMRDEEERIKKRQQDYEPSYMSPPGEIHGPDLSDVGQLLEIERRPELGWRAWHRDFMERPETGGKTMTTYLEELKKRKLSYLCKSLVKLADSLDKKQFHDEADELDEILKEMLSDDMPEIIEDLEEKQENKKKNKTKPEEKDKAGVGVLVDSNGHVGTGVTDNQNSGMFSGFSDSYFYSGYGNLEGAYGPG